VTLPTFVVIGAMKAGVNASVRLTANVQ